MPVETLKVGRDKVETPVTQMSDKDLKWYANDCKSASLKSIARREIARRQNAGGSAAASQAQPSQAINRAPPTAALAIEGNFGEPGRATAALKAAAEAYHLISPATMVGSLPEGCSVALALVHISPKDPHLYKVGGKLALDKTHLASIGNAIGASTVYSRRTDDGSDPHYCAWTVKVQYRQFDGTWLTRQGSVEMDVREPHGAEYVDAVRKAKKAERDPESQIGELRRFITRHAESKALNRAYAALGIRRSYTADELERPFCIARVTFTGESVDPVARAQFREGIMQSFLSSTVAAFGPADYTPPSSDGLHPPPPQSFHDTEGEEYPPEDWEPEPSAAQRETPSQPPPATQAGSGADDAPGPEKY
jgi:hypothetical protein